MERLRLLQNVFSRAELRLKVIGAGKWHTLVSSVPIPLRALVRSYARPMNRWWPSTVSKEKSLQSF